MDSMDNNSTLDFTLKIHKTCLVVPSVVKMFSVDQHRSAIMSMELELDVIDFFQLLQLVKLVLHLC